MNYEQLQDVIAGLARSQEATNALLQSFVGTVSANASAMQTSSGEGAALGGRPQGSSPNISAVPFEGSPRENIKNWIFTVENLFKARSLNKDLWQDYAISWLRGLALVWYRDQATNGGEPSTWEDFKKVIEKRFTPIDRKFNVRRQLDSLRQQGSVEVYYSRILELLNTVTMNEDDKVHYFIKGLKPAVKSELIYQAPSTLQDAAEIAIKYDRAHFNAPRRDFYRPQAPRPANDGPQPMELGFVDKQRPPLTPDERRRLMREGKCFRCREGKHMSWECPLNQKNKNTQGKANGRW